METTKEIFLCRKYAMLGIKKHGQIAASPKITFRTMYNRVVQISVFLYFDYGEGGGDFIWV